MCVEQDQTLTITVSSAAGMTGLLTQYYNVYLSLVYQSTFHYYFTINKLMP